MGTLELEFYETGRNLRGNKEVGLYAQVDEESGEIESAQSYCNFLNDWVDVTAFVKKSSHWTEKIKEEFEHVTSPEQRALYKADQDHDAYRDRELEDRSSGNDVA